MDKVIESNVTGECISKNESQEISANACREKENVPKNPLLYLFVQYVWDPRHGACYEGQEYKKLENWLESAEIIYWRNSITFRNLDGSPFCTTRKLNSRISYADFQRKSQDSRDRIILAHVVYQLNVTIGLLNLSKGDVNYDYALGQTILHKFCREFLEVPANAPENQISKTQKVITSLIEMGIDVKARDDSGDTALHIVTDNCVDKEGNHKDSYVDLVRTLVSKGAKVNVKNNNGITPVHLAAGKFQVDMLKFFADEGANFDERTNDDQTVLQYACRSTQTLKGSSKIIKTFDFLIAQACDLMVLDIEGHTLLHLAAEFQIVEIVERLIALGMSVDCRTKGTLLTPLYLAAKGDKLDNMKALVRAGADVNTEAADGSTPIFMAAMMGSYESMQFLMDQGADLHRHDSLMGLTVLHMAANGVELRGNFEESDEAQADRVLKKLKVLIELGLDVNDAGNCGVTPLQTAILLPNIDAVKLLLDRGANVNYQNQWTALELAIAMRDFYGARTATRRDASGRYKLLPRPVPGCIYDICLGVHLDSVKKDDVRLSCPIKKLWSCRVWRTTIRYIEIVSVLIDYGADVNIQNPSGETALHLIPHHKDGSVEMILDAGAHVNVHDNKGKMPVHYACETRDDMLMKLLLNVGADINDDDTSDMIMKSFNGSKTAAIKHVIKRKFVGLPIAKVYESLINASECPVFYEQCAKEAAYLKSHRDDDGFSLYEFLRMNPKFQCHYNDKISRNYKNLEKLFPMYAGLIRGACRESDIRRQLLEQARIVWAENSGTNLPYVCVERILSYLSNRYLEVMTTVKKIKMTSVGREMAVFEYLFR